MTRSIRARTAMDTIDGLRNTAKASSQETA